MAFFFLTNLFSKGNRHLLLFLLSSRQPRQPLLPPDPVLTGLHQEVITAHPLPAIIPDLHIKPKPGRIFLARNNMDLAPTGHLILVECLLVTGLLLLAAQVPPIQLNHSARSASNSAILPNFATTASLKTEISLLVH